MEHAACRVLYQNKIGIIGASGWLFKKKSIMMHGNMNVKCLTNFVKCLDCIRGGQQDFQAA
jgi:hypothetical protein